jgi:predicted amidohydrolase YtcJ
MRRLLPAAAALAAGSAAFLLSARSPHAAPPQSAATAQRSVRIYTGGDILTMRGEAPEYVEALAIEAGKIIHAGSLAEARQMAGASPETVPLAGRTLLPGFIDGHGHIADYVMSWGKPDLSPPPVGDTRTIADIQNKLAAYLAKSAAPTDQLVVISGYDDSLLEEKRHPTRHDLDKVSTTVPILIVHASGHLVVANSPALAMVGITAETPDPDGGVIQREEGSKIPNGVLEETAGYPFMARLPKSALPDQLRMLDEIQAWWASYGLTTAQDGLSNPASLAMLREADRTNRLILDVVSYPMWKLLGKVGDFDARAASFDIYPPGSQISNAGRAYESERPASTPLAIDAASRGKLKIGTYGTHHKIGGIKITLDGSPQGKTAFMTQPYHAPPPGQKQSYRAYPTLEQQEVNAWFDAAYRHGIQVIAHTNGDAAVDQLLTAVAAARGNHGDKDLRPVAIHAQLARYAQLDRMKDLGVMPSFFSAHTFFWGDWHVQSFGRDRAHRISPIARAHAIGLKCSNHNDSPVVPPDMMRLVWSAVNRLSRSGEIIGSAERVSPFVALKAVTSWAAWQYFEDDSKGTLEKGKRADLVVLERNPLKVEPTSIIDIRVMETIKDGKTIWLRK